MSGRSSNAGIGSLQAPGRVSGRATTTAAIRASAEGGTACCGRRPPCSRQSAYPLLQLRWPAQPPAISASADERQAACRARSPRTSDSSTSGRQHAPANFDNRAALVGAEIARIEGRTRSTPSAFTSRQFVLHTQNGFIHNEADRLRGCRTILCGTRLRQDSGCVFSGSPVRRISAGAPKAKCTNSISNIR